MSKSTGNTLLPKELFTEDNILGREFSPQVVRFFILMAQYRKVLDFSKEAIISAEKGYNKLKEAFYLLYKLEVSNESDFNVDVWKDKCLEGMNDDFNTPILISFLFEAVKNINSINNKNIKIDKKNLILLRKYFKEFCLEVLGLKFEKETNNKGLDGAMDIIIELREKARENKDWETSDFIRDKLKESGINLNDGKKSTNYNIKK